jgi:hypothetical protein
MSEIDHALTLVEIELATYRRTCRVMHLELALRALEEVRRLSRGHRRKPTALSVH